MDQLASEDSEVAEYVQTLEEARDTAELPEASGEAIAREFERYLRRRDGGPGQGPGGHATESGDIPYLRDPATGRTRPPKPPRTEPGRGRDADGQGAEGPDETPGKDPGNGSGETPDED
ncbi:PAC2 domain containing protein OS=Streptomyces griseus subsp. griseus (strain JCM 4626 / NBRC)OX=455632 GN=SGR_5841 PE=4 SV=1 [Streptomyces griseus subsp. griseus]